MVEKDTREFSGESFKEKILRQLEENSNEQMALSEQDLPEKTPFERPISELSSANNGEEHQLDEFKSSNEDGRRAREDFLSASDETYQEINTFRIKKDDEQPHQEDFSLNHRVEQNKEVGQEHSIESADSSPEFIAPQYNHNRRRQEKMSGETEQYSEKEEMTRKSSKKSPKKKTTAGKIIAVIALVLVLTIAGAGWGSYNFIKSSLQPLNQNNHTTKAINIPAGSSSKQIGNILQRQGIIKNGVVFQYYTKFKNYTDFKSGYYNFSPDMTLSEIADELEKGGTQKPVAPTLGKITIPEGQTLEQISKTITVNANEKNGQTPFKTEDFMKVVQDSAFIAKMKAAYPKLFDSLPEKSTGVKYQLEGYLFPATYEYTKKSTVESVVESMIDTMNTQLTPYYDKIKSNDDFNTVNSVLSVAALVEKEANNDDDRRNVARVFINRFRQGMTWDSNVSVLYAEGKLGTKTTLKEDATIDTKLNSPFNLYLNTGTGPGPVDNPSLSSIKAVLNPATNEFYYFVADVTTGKVYFAKTLEEQNVNVKKYVNDKL